MNLQSFLLICLSLGMRGSLARLLALLFHFHRKDHKLRFQGLLGIGLLRFVPILVGTSHFLQIGMAGRNL